ncbi:RNA replicase [Rhizorhapis suberifaciens]|uniref:DNA-binding transcriptional ArsR family regulator n=1 Tax=Rhizorhapis suberifaciens TaxID=13656 RepID=A0A840HYC9_9SPHN|nr:RNA replicase [Rhizorhapis suberifaciens]MBB4642661.1 DNA-binding transcriptional ArsR family regulator [Rhizorhapis suberifaciens]
MGAISIARASFMALERVERVRTKSRSGAQNRTHAHVHPNSRRAGTFEDDFFYSYAKGETDRLYKKAVELLKRKNAVRRLARAEGRQLTEDERLATLITNAALRVFEQLTTLARTCAGKVFPTWEWIETASGLSRASVGRGLSILAKMGLLEKQRRCVPIDPPADRPKARNAQTSNVYRMSFPNRLARFLPRFLRPVPLPDDVVQGEIDRIEEIEAMRLWRSPRQVVAEDIEDEGLRRVLDSLAIALEKKESQKNGQPLLDSYVLAKDGVGLVGQRSNA